MTPTSTPAPRSAAPASRVIAAPRASDALAGVFRAAFGATDDTPDDFRTLLAQLDRCEPSKH
ncbi:MAG: hypothetical protein JWL96_679 [Sphingomonas bacterium]|uniref:hypothetical protein n=1 Tax=Sphingomonas bacterium TaxID=1895847 RepID=UPI0026303A79|nr:hypothetical protein [Sphingomonas bacterium]MDB5708609.1 hypothetical protein [Sphingomonas bacterium]